MSELDKTSTTITRQRTLPRYPTIDHEAVATNNDYDPYDPYTSAPPSNTMEQRYDALPFQESPPTLRSNSPRKRRRIGTIQSLRAIVCSSLLNIFYLFGPVAWTSHFMKWSSSLTFTLCFLALVPHELIFDWGGEQLALYCGKDIGDLIVITLNNIIEATLAIILLVRCQLKLLQSTIIGVIVLHLLLIPGASFLIGGARIRHQDLHANKSELNHSLLTIGVMSLLLPAAFFSALDRNVATQIDPETTIGTLVTDEARGKFLVISRGLAVILLVVYITSRIYLHNPPHLDRDDVIHSRVATPAALEENSLDEEEEEPKANLPVLIVVLASTIGVMAVTTEWLVESVENIREDGEISGEWFGMILLPILSFAADGVLAAIYFLHYLFRHFFKDPEPPAIIAKARAIDLSIQFTLFWMPLIVLLSWWLGKPFSLLFDFFEIAVLLGACFIVNYVTADAKTNWAEGFAMVAFYAMIALCAWFYTGQPEITILLGCQSVRENIAQFVAAQTHS